MADAELFVPYGHLDYGESKVGKTDYLLSVFDSKYIKPEEVLYLDNHGSTRGFGAPRYDPKKPYGVKAIRPDKPESFLKECEKIRSNIARGTNKYKVVILDDVSEHAQAAIQRRNKEQPGKSIRNWGEHLDAMTEPIRLILPEYSGIIMLMSARAGRMTDVLEDKSKLMDANSDNPDTVIRPLIQGQFGTWILFQFDLISFHEFDKVGTHGTADFWPAKDRYSGNRFLKKWSKMKIPRKVEDMTFDKVYEIVQKVAQEETNDG